MNFALATEPGLGLVVGLGVGVVFVGLICIIGIISVMNLVCSGALKTKKESDIAPAASAPAAASASAPIENRQEIIAAVCAAVAEENGTDISAIRVISFKKL